MITEENFNDVVNMLNDKDNMKMSVIVNIQMLEKQLDFINLCTFEALWKTDYESLRTMQDNYIAHYNKLIEDRMFASDLLYR